MDIQNNRFTYNLADLIPADINLSGESYGQQYDIISKVAYLIGVPKKIFENENEPPKVDIYNRLELEKKARIIRNLCSLRTQLERGFLKICQGIQREGRSIIGMPEYISSNTLQQLSEDGIDIYKNLKEPTQFLININQNIKNRINNCRDLFPDWLEWKYLSDIFIMPDGLSETGTKKAAEFYYTNFMHYPYQQYINWPAEDEGNILYCDGKFVPLLYSWNNDEFVDMSLVSDVSDRTKGNIYKFIEDSSKCIFIVDCENSDPYRLCAAVKNLDAERLSKIEKIILFDDVHAASAWEMLSSHVKIPVEYILIERLKDNKSLADVKVAARTAKEFYSNDVDSFVLVSSDSDYWGLIEELPNANFLIMVEHEKCSYALKEALIQHGIFYCYIDDFYSGDGEGIKMEALQRELSRAVKASLDLNLYHLMDEVLERTRIRMTRSDIESFINRKIKNNLKLEISDDGNIEIEYRVKK
ncbi:NYN domain-containing protein [Oribacterium sp. P6A1]|uniref:NYN domain-containing protein n=1 Tax=Oribacterium sp. P6A1 TaxID=1410612 RepID=UPI00068A1025|nr:NYN domain-containing protein [Oribacterium sp. P6A1]